MSQDFRDKLAKGFEDTEEIIYDPYMDTFANGIPHEPQIKVFAVFMEAFQTEDIAKDRIIIEEITASTKSRKALIKDIILMCGRRAGKSFIVSCMIYYVLTVKKSNVCLIVPELQTFEQALWLEIKQRAKDTHGLIDGKTIIYTKNSKKVKFVGKDWGDLILYPILRRGNGDGVRGVGKNVKLFVIEEAGVYPDHLLLEIMEKGIDPIKLEDKEVRTVVLGTPPSDKGTFVDLFNNDETLSFRFTCYDNPFIIDPDEAVKAYCRKYNHDIKGATVQREIFARPVLDSNITIFDFEEENNMFKYSHEEKYKEIDGWVFTGGLDIGYDDHSALVISCYNIYSCEFRIMYKDGGGHKTIGELRKMVDYALELYPDIPIYCDTAGGGAKMMIESFRRMDTKYENSLLKAKKQHKMADLKLLNSLFREKKAFIDSDFGDIIKELNSVKWKHNSRRIQWADVDSRIPNDYTDALLYSIRGVFDMNSDKPLFSEAVKKTEDELEEERMMAGEIEAYYKKPNPKSQ